MSTFDMSRGEWHMRSCQDSPTQLITAGVAAAIPVIARNTAKYFTPMATSQRRMIKPITAINALLNFRVSERDTEGCDKCSHERTMAGPRMEYLAVKIDTITQTMVPTPNGAAESRFALAFVKPSPATEMPEG